MKLSEELQSIYDMLNGPCDVLTSLQKLHSAIQEAKELEQNQVVWHKYPDVKPIAGKRYLICIRTNRSETCNYTSTAIEDNLHWKESDVIAWAELPKYEEGK